MNQGLPTERVAIVRPLPRQWQEIIAVLETANFHHIGGPEMPSFPLEDCFVATVDGAVRGVGGYRILSATEAKTTLLAVDRRFAALGLGVMLQKTRLNHLRNSGIKTVTANTDDPRVERWLARDFGFVRTGSWVPKLATFGRKDADHWVSLRVELK